jgi:hypothetical protein
LRCGQQAVRQVDRQEAFLAAGREELQLKENLKTIQLFCRR